LNLPLGNIKLQDRTDITTCFAERNIFPADDQVYCVPLKNIF